VLKVLIAIVYAPFKGFSLSHPMFCIDYGTSNVFKETTKVLDNEEAKCNNKDLPAEGTAEQKSSVTATLLQPETVRRGAACMCEQEECCIYVYKI
jgi:hypothetical protein